MICKIIGKAGEPGSGAGAEAFGPGVAYVCAKASTFALKNLTSRDWRDAAPEMRLTAGLSDRVKKPNDHLVLSWHDHEQPTDAQMLDAMEQILEALGLGDHQAAIGTHHDRAHKHVHAVVNTVHPLSGKAWSKGQDRMKAEQACRQIELDQGWTSDRGRFDVAIKREKGRPVAQLKPKPPEHWAAKRAARKVGRRPKTDGQVKSEKRTAVPAFDQIIPEPLRAAFQEAVDQASDWPSLHTALGHMGLRYEAFGSGARVKIIGAPQGGAGFAKASSFGARYAIKKLEARLGPYDPATPDHYTDLKPVHDRREVLLGLPSPAVEKASRAAAFKLTLLARTYTGIFLNPHTAGAIRFVHLQDYPPQITFRDGATVQDHGSRLSTSEDTPDTRATMLAMAIAKGWDTVQPKGSAAFVRTISIEAAQAGLMVTGVPDEVQAIADKHLAAFRAQERRINQEAETVRLSYLAATVDREDAVDMNKGARRTIVTAKANVRSEAQAATDALGAQRSLPQLRARLAIRDEEVERLNALPDARRVPRPQGAPDADLHDRPGLRRLSAQLRETDAAELKLLEQLDISVVAAALGWVGIQQPHLNGSDQTSRRTPVFRRDNDEIKARLVNGTWLWTSQKMRGSGSVIDLWFADHPEASIAHAHAALRELLGGTSPSPVSTSPPTSGKTPLQERHDHTYARRRWDEAAYLEAPKSYAEYRGISRHTVDRFPDQVRIGAFGHVYFAHRNIDTGHIQGFELGRAPEQENPTRARFADGGHKSVGILGDPATAGRVVVVETGLDALAIAEMDDRSDTLYVSTGGGLSRPTQAALLRLADGRAVLSGFGAHAQGETLHRQLLTILPDAKRISPGEYAKDGSPACSSWLDVLNARKASEESQTLKVEAADRTEGPMDPVPRAPCGP